MLNSKAAREIVGTDITMRMEVMAALAGVKGAYTHYAIKTANMLGGALRAEGDTAKNRAEAILNQRIEGTEITI